MLCFHFALFFGCVAVFVALIVVVVVVVVAFVFVVVDLGRVVYLMIRKSLYSVFGLRPERLKRRRSDNALKATSSILSLQCAVE